MIAVRRALYLAVLALRDGKGWPFIEPRKRGYCDRFECECPR